MGNYFVLNENENTTYQNLWDATKHYLEGFSIKHLLEEKKDLKSMTSAFILKNKKIRAN